MGELATKGKLYHRTRIVTDSNKIAALGIRNETERSIVANREAETLHVEGLGCAVPIEGGICPASIKFLNAEQVSLVTVAKVVRSGVEGSVLEDGKNLVLSAELTQMNAAAVLVKTLNVSIEPDVLAADSRYTLVLKGNLLDGVLGYKIAPGSASLDGQGREVVLN